MAGRRGGRLTTKLGRRRGWGVQDFDRSCQSRGFSKKGVESSRAEQELAPRYPGAGVGGEVRNAALLMMLEEEEGDGKLKCRGVV